MILQAGQLTPLPASIDITPSHELLEQIDRKGGDRKTRSTATLRTPFSTLPITALLAIGVSGEALGTQCRYDERGEVTG
jgi:hypothetical protein